MNRGGDVDTISCCGVPVVAGDELSISGGFYHTGINSKGGRRLCAVSQFGCGRKKREKVRGWLSSKA